MSGSLWLKRLERRYAHYHHLTPEEIAKIEAEQARIAAWLETHPLPELTPEEITRFQAAIQESDEEGWIPAHPKTLAPMNGVRVFIPKLRRFDQ